MITLQSLPASVQYHAKQNSRKRKRLEDPSGELAEMRALKGIGSSALPIFANDDSSAMQPQTTDHHQQQQQHQRGQQRKEEKEEMNGIAADHEHSTQEKQQFGSIFEYMRARSNADKVDQQPFQQQGEQEKKEEEEQQDQYDQRRLFVRNVAYSATEDDVRTFFEEASSGGVVEDVHMLLHKATLQPRGIAYVTLDSSESTDKALQSTNNAIMQGRIVSVSRATSKSPTNSSAPKEKSGGTSSFKRQQEADKENQARNRRAWNALFLRQDAVADAIGDRLGMSKADVLSPESSGLAVKLSIGEAEIINEAKESLSQQGVHVSLLERAANSAGPDPDRKETLQRSSTTLLLKNLPYSAKRDEIASICERSGSLLRLVLPSTGMIAIADFADAADAKKAFKKLAFRKFGSKPIYVDFAPVNTLAAADSMQTAAAGKAQTTREITTATLEPAEAGHGFDQEAESRTISVKNVPVNAASDQIRSLVERAGAVGGVQSVRLESERNLRSSKQATVELSRSCKTSASAVAKALTGSSLGARQLYARVKPTVDALTEVADGVGGADAKLQEPKLLVRNVPFEAKKSEIRELFKPFGTVKAVRLPKKVGGSHRGFAFVEMGSKSEAKQAMRAVKQVHFYGRHLVVEGAKQAEGVEELREHAKRVADAQPDVG